MDAKFLITVDYHQDNGIPEKMLEHIPIVVDSKLERINKFILLLLQLIISMFLKLYSES